MTKIVAISDIHGQLPGTGELPPIPECDILLIAGDICPANNHMVEIQANWISNVFNEWLLEQPATDKIFIAGNHDFVYQHAKDLIFNWEGIYLEDDGIEVQGFKIWGSPWQKWFYNWAFNAPEENGEAFLDQRWQLWDDDTDILVLHGPPYGCRDFVPRQEHTGSQSLRTRIEATNELAGKPELVVCGHIHCARGFDKIGNTTVVNAAMVNEKYKMVYKPVVITLEDKKVINVNMLGE